MIEASTLKMLCENLNIKTSALPYFYDYYKEQMQLLSICCMQEKLDMLTSHIHYFNKDTKSYSVKKIQAEIVQIYSQNKNKF